MICVSVAEPTVAACLRRLRGLDFAEIRLDRMRVGAAGVKKIFSKNERLIACCRPGGRSKKKRLGLLLTAVEAGAAYVDLELEAGARFKERIVRTARSRNCRVIVSYHNFEKTPPRPELEETISRALAAGADIVKIACLVRSRRDSARLLGLLDSKTPLIVVGMGEKGRLTRLLAPLLGGVFTYASLGAGKETAEGQSDAISLRQVLAELKRHVRA
jgi:3-dehydroquinate dehydratase-1